MKDDRDSFSRSVGGDEPWGQWLTRGALVLAFALAIARVTMPETIRDPFPVTMDSPAAPRGAGAATGVVLDALAWVPLLMVLLRRTIDRTFQLRLGWSMVPLAVLAAWALASTAWSSDKFVALVGAFHFASAVVLFVATAQLVTTWSRLRLTAGIAFGLLLVFVAHGAYYRWVDLPDTQLSWQKNKDDILRQHNWEPGSFAAEQFAKKITGSEMMGFSASPNTFAAVIVLASVIAAGLATQRLRDRDHPAWLIPYALGIAAGTGIVWYTHSKAALAAMALGVGAAALLAALSPRVRARAAAKPALAYWTGVGAVLLGVLAVVGHGLYHGGLPSDSLNFRWRYWVGSARLLGHHPILGVGWNNFGAHYIGVRLQSAAEEIKDPHNFLLRFLFELGAVGGVLAVAWLLRLAWEAARPVPLEVADADDPDPVASPVRKVALIAGAGILLNTLASLDLGEQVAYVVVELFKRGLFFCVLLIGGALATLRRIDPAEGDRRPAERVADAVLIALGLFLVQSLIDVAFFETGPMYLWFLLAGAIVGFKSHARRTGDSRVTGLIALAGTSLAWLVAIVAVVGPVVMGEALAAGGDQAIRDKRPDRAVREYERAAAAVPWNPEYTFRAAKAALAAGDLRRATQLLDAAIDNDPTSVEMYMTRASAALAKSPPDIDAARRDYRNAIDLNPQDVGMRVGYADTLARLGLLDEAREQYRIALEKDKGYDPTEPRRLSESEVARIQKALGGG